MQNGIALSPNLSAAVYARISSDKTGISAGVERQEADCCALAERLGLTVTHVLIDNDISAYSGKPRPGYRQLLDLMKNSEIGTVLAFHQDRLQRSQKELEEYVDISEAGSVTTHTVLAGHIDLSTPAGRFNARIIGAAARYEVEHMIERQRAAKLQAAKNGDFLGGQRPYGFEPQRKAVRESEAKVIREMAGRLIDGESYNAIAIDLNRRGITTQHGKAWRPINIENLLGRHINAGISFHKGVEHKAKSPAIFTPDEWADLQIAMKQRSRQSKHPGRFRKHLLNGLLYCGICDGKLYHRSKKNRDGSYRISAACGITNSATGQREGCFGVSRMTDPIIDLVTDAVLYRLDSPYLARQMKKSGDDPLKELMARQRVLTQRQDEISDDYYVHGLLARQEFERQKLGINGELADVEKQIDKLARSRALPNLALTDDIRTAWDQATIEWRRDLLFQVIERIYVKPRPTIEGYAPPRYKEWRFDPELIDIRWRI